MASLRIKTEPASEPLTLDEAKLHLKVDEDADDTLINMLIKVARQDIEIFLGRALITQTWELGLDCFPATVIHIPRPPLQAIVSIKYLDTAGVEQTLAASLYQVDVKSEWGRIAPTTGQLWPYTQVPELAPVFNAVTIEYRAGYGDTASAVPVRIIEALKLQVAYLYENRGEMSGDPPRAIRDLLWSDRMMDLFA